MAEDISKMVLLAFYVFYCLVVSLQVCLYIQHACVLDLGDILELEVLQSNAVGKDLDGVV